MGKLLSKSKIPLATAEFCDNSPPLLAEQEEEDDDDDDELL